MEGKEKYRPKNQLQKDCLRQFRKWFPDFASKIEFVEPLMHPDNFCFTIKSDSPEFGNLAFDIDNNEITVFTEFDHHHYNTYLYNDEKDESIKRLKTIWTALTSVKDLIAGNEIIELEKKGNQIIKAFRFHKHDPDHKYSVVINLESESEKLDSDQNIPVERLLVNWNGILSKEILTTAANKGSNAMAAELSENNESNKINIWAKLKRLWS